MNIVKKCSSANICNACESEYKLINNICEERIEGCRVYNESYYLEKDPDNGFEKGYIECIKCDDTRNYYCVGDNKEWCEIILDISSYYFKDNNCIENCLEKYDYCKSCDKNKCNECLQSHYLNNENKCQNKILHCIDHDLNSNPSECIKCEDNYACWKMTKKYVVKFQIKIYIIILIMKIFVWINVLIDLHIVKTAKKMFVKIVKSNILFIIKFNV